MSLELAPEIESKVIARAVRAGVTPSDYLARLLENAEPPLPPGRQAPRIVPVSLTEGKRLNATTSAWLEARLAEAENATPQEIAEANAEHNEFRKAMNANRRATGERILYPDVEE